MNRETFIIEPIFYPLQDDSLYVSTYIFSNMYVYMCFYRYVCVSIYLSVNMVAGLLF